MAAMQSEGKDVRVLVVVLNGWSRILSTGKHVGVATPRRVGVRAAEVDDGDGMVRCSFPGRGLAVLSTRKQRRMSGSDVI